MSRPRHQADTKSLTADLRVSNKFTPARGLPIIVKLRIIRDNSGGFVPQLYFWEAIQQALISEMDRDPRVVLLGEDIGVYGGAFKVTRGLLEKYGPSRVIDTPISEAAVAGICAGAAMTGLRPVMELMFMDFATHIFDQLLNHASKFRYMYGGSVCVPMVVRAPAGGGRGYGPTHSQSLESYLMKIPGLKVVAPSCCDDARGLLISAIRDDNPVFYVEHKKLYGLREEVSPEPVAAEIGKARMLKNGNDVTLISYSYMISHCLTVADALEKNGVSATVLDLRSLSPLDDEAISKAVEASGRVVVVEEGTRTCGVGAEVIARIVANNFYDLDAPPVRVAAPDAPIPCSTVLENALLPSPSAIMSAVNSLLS